MEHLTPGTCYVVIQSFEDSDGTSHPVGETWTFLGHGFLPHEDGVSLFVSFDGAREWHIRMQWRNDQQGVVLNNLAGYIQAAG